MRPLHTSAFVAIALVGCVSQAQTTPEYGADYAGTSSGPGDQSDYLSGSWVGPPGGGMDPSSGYADPNLAQSPSENSDPYANMYGGAMYGGQAYGNAYADPSAPAEDPSVWAGATAEVTDGEIDMTLDAYGEWVEDADYGRVWRPYTTVVGADFTPYESCGDWVYTDYGWTFQSCDAWAWGWLAFHFGRWVYLDDGWCWSRDYTWGPGWVEWRHGGGYVGWRPMRPTRQIRDHRDRYSGPLIRDHRTGKHEPWHFTRNDDFGRRPIRQSPSVDINEGLRATTSVAQPPVRGDFRGRVGTVMAGRLRDHQRFEARTRGAIGQSTRGYQPSPSYNNNVGAINTRPSRGYNNSVNTSVGATRGYNPTYNPTVVSPNPNRPTWTRGGNTGYRYNPPSNNGGYRYNPPSNNGGYRYNPPTRTPPTNTGSYRYNAPANNGGYRYTPPSNSGYRYTPPSGGGYRYNPPSRSSSSGSSWGGSRGSAPSPSSRPSSNWSGGSRSSSPAPSRSSGSYSSPSRSSSSSSSSSRSSSSSSSSSGGSRGGGRHR